MTELHTEEEQIKAFKQWWQSNGKALLIIVGLLVAATIGWKGWQSHQLTQAEAASALYQNMLEEAIAGVGEEGDIERLVEADLLAEQLKDEYANSVYAKLAALMQARFAVDEKDYEKALASINWVLKKQPPRQMRVVATMRKARLLAVQGNYDQALELLDNLEAGKFEASIEELRGDLLLQQNEEQAARAAYQKAQDAAQEVRPLLNMKLDDLAEEK